MADIKHVGRINSTGRKCIVVFRTLPGDAFNALVAPTEFLSDSYHDALINFVESSAGQDAYELGEALARALFPDGNKMLDALHLTGRLVKVPTDQIDMVPNPSTRVKLSELNQIIAEQRGVSVQDLPVKPAAGKETLDAAKKEAVQTEIKEATAPAVVENLSPEDQAKKFRSEADRLSKEAAALRRQAEELVPTKKKVVTAE
jgi:hypothetical protein